MNLESFLEPIVQSAAFELKMAKSPFNLLIVGIVFAILG
jgi:hypothetical protein